MAVVVMLLVSQLVALAWPAYACGCGGMIPAGDAAVGVKHESAVVSWDGRTEQIVMELTVSGDAEETAWVMPVPNRADVRLGDTDLLGEVSRLSASERGERSHFWPRSGDWPFPRADRVATGDGARPGLTVDVVRQRLGPFDVARLAADDPDALSGWLEDNGFELPPRMARELRPYVERGWQYVAVRLVPGDEDRSALQGTLEPLHITFASDELVYPMRLSRAARNPQRLRLDVLAEHRMRPASAIGGREPDLRFAGRLRRPPPAIRDLITGAGQRFAGKGVFLTSYDQFFPDPRRIDGDHVFRPAPRDEEFRTYTYDDELLMWGGVPAWVVTLGAGHAALLAFALWFWPAARRRRRR